MGATTMNTPGCLAFALLLGTLSTMAQDFEAGSDTELAIGTPAHKTMVYVPSDYVASRSWPLILYYHGTNGRPETRTIRSFLDGKHAIVIGMAYREQGLLVLNGNEHMAEHTKKDLAHLNLVLTTVAKDLSIDKKQIYLSGVSKGGWTTSLLGHQRPGIFAGMALLMGGKQKFGPPSPQPTAFKDKPIYIGVGETDNNYVFSRLGEATWGGLGAEVTFDTWMGIGHAFPDDMETFEYWLRREVAPDTIREDAVAWLQAALPEAKAIEGPVERYRALLRLHQDPREPLGGEEDRKALREALKSVISSDATVQRLVRAKRHFRETMVKEMRIKTLVQMKYVRDQYARLQREPLGPDWKPLVEQAYERVSKAYNASLDATRAASRPATPTPTVQPQPNVLRPSFPGNPLRITPPTIRRR